VIEETASVKAGAAYTVAPVGALADIQAAVFGDDLGAPGSGKAKVRVIHAAPEVPAVDLAVEDGPTLFEGAEFPSATDYAEVDAASYPVQVKRAGGDEVLLEADLAVKAGTIYSVAAIGGAGEASAWSRSWTRPVPAGPRTAASPPAPAGPRPAPPSPARPWPRPASPPVRVEIPAIGVSSRLVRLGLNPDGTMEVPRDYGLAGWFTGGATPGRDGPAVAAGHVDSRSGPAVFYRLRELRPGDTVGVLRADGGRVAFQVTGVARYAKRGFPTDAVFGPVTGPVLRLVTCGGAFDRSSRRYLDNVVVSARPAAP
jgi:sortase family protein/uncharacterized protein DUF4397